MTKDDLLASIRRDHATLDALVSPLAEDRMLTPELEAGRSVKDVLAHISAWEQLCVKWIETGRRDEGPFTQESIDALNNRIYEANRERPVAKVLADSRASYEAVLAAAEAVEDLDAAPAWASGRPMGVIISSNSDEHYREHIEQIEAWVRLAAERSATGWTMQC